MQIASSEDVNFTVESPTRLKEIDTGKRRELDVLATYKNGNHTTRIAFECKDEGRKVGVPHIEAFHSKLMSLNVDIGILVSSSGFTATALPKAAAKKIVLQTIEESTEFDWLDTAGVLEDLVRFKTLNIICENIIIGEHMADHLYDINNELVSRSDILDHLMANILSRPEEWNYNTEGQKFGESKSTFPENNIEMRIHGISAAKLENGTNIKLSECKIIAVFEIHRVFKALGYFINRTLQGRADDMRFAKVKSSVAVAENINSMIVSEKFPDKITVTAETGDESKLGLRVSRSLVSWAHLKDKLLIAGKRHHLGVSVNCDGLSFCKFESDNSSSGKEFDGVNRFVDLKKDGVSTITFK